MNVDIKRINNNMVSDFVEDLIQNKKLNSKTVKDIIVLLKQIFSYADIKVNIPSPKVHKNNIEILEKKEQKKLEDYLKSNKSSLNISILLSLYTGIRIGELCSIRWSNIDFQKNLIHISNTILRIKDWNENDVTKTRVIIDTPKSVESIRDIPIPNDIMILLNEAHQKVDNDDCYLITNKMKYMEPRTFYYHYKKIMKELDLDHYNFHTLRHTFATRCIELGFDYKTLSEILGHSDVQITLSMYVHPSNELKYKNMEKLKLF